MVCAKYQGKVGNNWTCIDNPSFLTLQRYIGLLTRRKT